MSNSTQGIYNWNLVTDLSNVIDNYVTRIIAAAGIIFNIFFLSILYNKKNRSSPSMTLSIAKACLAVI